MHVSVHVFESVCCTVCITACEPECCMMRTGWQEGQGSAGLEGVSMQLSVSPQVNSMYPPLHLAACRFP